MANRNGVQTVDAENKPLGARVLPFMLLTAINLFPCACNGPGELDSKDKQQETSNQVLTIPLMEYDLTLTKDELQQSLDAISQLPSRISFAFEGRWGELIWCDVIPTPLRRVMRLGLCVRKKGLRLFN